ncbi:hypothetical protein FY145_01065 [Agrobacterium tumefaciens]|uniref:hypothetical protein n=1 Tax=Agrobacterium tumefaciens TaxID=358 RepID=UPI0021D283EE|nr:hypothetical protein [Agrobacterium tumefaciens]UXS69165.1 hypothetical protein FY146_01065 [Agrobacterium tumefaciens]UXS76828.1 hypothetical protein FY145_01065 [Agrobacterium tumefaciens]
MSVEELNAQSNDAAHVDPGMMNTDVSEDDALAAAFDRASGSGSSRDEGGRFKSNAADNAAGDGADEPLEGGEGEGDAAGDTSTPPAGVPLPSSWRGKEALWGKIPEDVKEDLRAHQEELHKTLSQQGQALSTFKPVMDVFSNYKEYFGGGSGNYKPHEAVDYLFNLQRQMDDNPIETLMTIADTYELRPQLQQMFGGTGEGGNANTETLLKTISRLESTIREMSDPSRIDERITTKLSEDREVKEIDDLLGRTSKDMPLYDQIPEPDLVSFIHMAKQKLGGSASKEAVLKRAYDMAVNADPDLRAKAAALTSAADNDPAKVAAAKRANATNLRSTSSGRGRELTEEEELAAVYDKHKGN